MSFAIQTLALLLQAAKQYSANCFRRLVSGCVSLKPNAGLFESESTAEYSIVCNLGEISESLRP